MKLMTLPQYMKMSKPALIRKITKTLRAMPKKRLAKLCYEITKSKLPRISMRQRKLTAETLVSYKRGTIPRSIYKRKRKFSRKQLAAQRLFAKRARAGTLKKGKKNKGWVERLSPKERQFYIGSRSRKMAGAGIRGLDC